MSTKTSRWMQKISLFEHSNLRRMPLCVVHSSGSSKSGEKLSASQSEGFWKFELWMNKKNQQEDGSFWLKKQRRGSLWCLKKSRAEPQRREQSKLNQSPRTVWTFLPLNETLTSKPLHLKVAANFLMLTNDVYVSELGLCSHSIDLAHVSALVLLLHVRNMQEPGLVFIMLIMCHRYSWISSNYMIMYSQYCWLLEMHPSDLQRKRKNKRTMRVSSEK